MTVMAGGSSERDARTGVDVLHVDMDCFYAAVEISDDPSLRNKPVIVGGTGPRGVVASCSYEARAKGVRSAMAMAEARRRCPEAVVLAGSHGRYGEVSARLNAIFRRYTPVVESIALDEAYLDVSGSHRLFGSSHDIAVAVRETIRDELGLQCSVGIGSSKLIAKLASEAAKPRTTATGPQPGRGIVVVAPDREIEFLHPLPVSELAGVGPRTADQLSRLGIHTIGELARIDQGLLCRAVGRAAGVQLHALASGRDDRPVVAHRTVKSIGHEETFPSDEYDGCRLRQEVLRLVDSVATRMRVAEVEGRTVTLKVRFGDFATITRSHSLPGNFLSSSEMAQLCCSLLDSVELSGGVRLIGVSVSSLEPRGSGRGRQLGLLDPSGEVEGGALDTAVGAIRDRYGADALATAALVASRRAGRAGNGDVPVGAVSHDRRAGGRAARGR
ncbi:MAG: DNA polymerase IV [Actinomycetota bacterium]|jgi:DNA polymerase-4|nr:DNA polymerase IV [Actinomycetota bacterium]